MFKKFLIMILNMALIFCGLSGCTEDEIAPTDVSGDSADNEDNGDEGGQIAAQPSDREDQSAIGFLTWRGDWHHSGLLGGIKGEITDPKIAWSYDVTGMQNIFKVDDTTTGSGTAEIAKSLSDGGDWVAGMAVNEGFSDSAFLHTREGYFLPGINEIQKIECDSAFNADAENLHIRFYIGGELQWESEKIPLLYNPLPIIGDFDGDGRMEVAILPWFDCYIFDLETGEKKHKARFMPEGADHGRAYGFIGAYDMDGDGKQEIFIMAHVGHMEMMGWDDDGNFVRKWIWAFELDSSHSETFVHLIENPIIDVTGDGKLELVTAVYNRDGDEKWHTYVVEPMTGEVTLDIVDKFLFDAVDMDRNGVWELVLMEAVNGRQVNIFGNMSIASVVEDSNGKLSHRELWAQENAMFSTRLRMYEGDNVNCLFYDSVAPVRYAKKSDGKLVFATTVYDDANECDGTLYLWEHTGDKIEKRCEIKGKRLQMIGNITTAPMIVSSVLGGESANLAYDGYVIKPSSQRNVVPEYSSVTVGQFMPGEALCAVVEGAFDTTMAFTVNDELSNTNGKSLINFPGRSMYTGMFYLSGSGMRRGHIELADLDGCGYAEVVSAWASPNGNAELRAVNYKGEVVWKHELIGVPIGRPEWNTGGLCVWAVGEFAEKGRLDVFITYRYDIVFSGRAVNGKTGEIIWDRITDDYTTHVGGTYPSIIDMDGDGLDDIVFTYSQYTCYYKGNTGEQINHAYGYGFGDTSVVMDFDGCGKPEILSVGEPNRLALFDNEKHETIWEIKGDFTAPVMPSGVLPAVTDFDGDGKYEIIMPMVPDGDSLFLRCYDVLTGEMKWSEDIPSFSSYGSSALAADIDSDGALEVIFTVGESLYCYAPRQDGSGADLKWSLSMPAVCQNTAIADFGQNGGVQIIMMCSDGTVYAVK